MSSSLRRVVRIRVLSSVVVKCRVVGIRVLSLALLCWGWVSVPRARHREWLPLPWSECDDRAGRKTFNVPNSRDWVLSLAQRGYGFGPLAGTLQHLAIRLFVGHSLIARLNGPLQPKSGSDPLLPCAREVHTHTAPRWGDIRMLWRDAKRRDRCRVRPGGRCRHFVRRKLLH